MFADVGRLTQKGQLAVAQGVEGTGRDGYEGEVGEKLDVVEDRRTSEEALDDLPEKKQPGADAQQEKRDQPRRHPPLPGFLFHVRILHPCPPQLPVRKNGARRLHLLQV